MVNKKQEMKTRLVTILKIYLINKKKKKKIIFI